MSVYTDRKGRTYPLDQSKNRRSRSGAFIICIHQGHILFVEETHGLGTPNLPGGGIDPGETALDSVKRELTEETGLKLPENIPITEAAQRNALYFADDEKEFWDYSQTYYIADNNLTDLFFTGQRPAPNNGKIFWIAQKDLDRTPIHAIHKQAIKDIL